jgi:hypothetical protein
VLPIVRCVVTTRVVSAAGRILLTNDLLNHLGVQPGDKLAIEKLPGGRIELKAARSSGKMSDVFGSL